MSESAPELSTPSAPDAGTSPGASEVAATPAQALARAQALVAAELDEVEVRLAQLLESSVAAVPQVVGHLAFAGGKRFRPLVTLLAARAAGYDADARLTVAAVGELLHTATLLHDDVIDGGEFRRGRPAARVLFGNGMAVLTGDFCLARALQAMSAAGSLAAVRSMSDAVTRMAEGEVAQLAMAGGFVLDRDRYYMVVDRKTAALIAWCTGVARLVPEACVAPLERYGLELGYAFQISDDVLDYAAGVARTGKARGQDLRDGKVTLPLLLACADDPDLREQTRAAMAAGPPMADDVADAIVARVTDSGALARARDIAHEHAQAATRALDPLPASPARAALADLAEYVVRRGR